LSFLINGIKIVDKAAVCPSTEQKTILALHHQKLATLPVKFAHFAIPNPVISSNPNYEASTLMCSHIITAIRGVTTFRLLEHKEVIRDVKAVLTTCNNARHETALNLLSSKLSCNYRRTIL
jgi:hypothetical protein